MHAQWQIAGLILLILLLAGILRRAVILIVTARSLRWSKLHQKAIDLTGRNLQTTNSNESGSATAGLTTVRIPYDSVYRDMSGYSPYGLDGELPYGEVPQDVSVDDENSFGSTGFQPGGVSYTQVPQRGGALIPKGRNRFGRRK
jgi:hypothetical protein